MKAGESELLALAWRPSSSRVLISVNEADNNCDDMRVEYDFSNGVRGKHVDAYRAGHSVRVKKSDGTVEECHFTLEDGAVMLDPDLKIKFPNSDAVNRALRSIVSQ